MRVTEWIGWGVVFAMFALIASACSTFTTPLRDCKAMCGDRGVLAYHATGETEKCECGKEKDAPRWSTEAIPLDSTGCIPVVHTSHPPQMGCL